MIRSRLLRYLLTLVLPSGLLCLIFLSSMFHDEQARVRQNLEVAERLRSGVEAEPLLTTPLVAVTVSIGAATLTPGQTVEELLALEAI